LNTSPLSSDLRASLEPLRRLVATGHNVVLPIVGSGLSQGLPSWSDLLHVLAHELPEHCRGAVLDLLGREKFLQAASYIESSPFVGRPRVLTQIKSHFQRPAVPRPEIYDDLVRLPLDHFITTNYDPWLKDALAARESRAPRVYVPADQGAFSDLLPNSPPIVLMVHGDADRPETCVLSDEGYRALLHGSPSWKHGLSSLAAQRCFVFIGHSLSDPDLNALIDETHEAFSPNGGAPRHFFLGAGISEPRVHSMRMRGIEPVDYVSHDQLAAVLCYLADVPKVESTHRKVKGAEASSRPRREPQGVRRPTRGVPLPVAAKRLHRRLFWGGAGFLCTTLLVLVVVVFLNGTDFLKSRLPTNPALTNRHLVVRVSAADPKNLERIEEGTRRVGDSRLTPPGSVQLLYSITRDQYYIVIGNYVSSDAAKKDTATLRYILNQGAMIEDLATLCKNGLELGRVAVCS